MFVSNEIDINSGESLVKGFATAIRDGLIKEAELETFILECVGGDETLTRVVLEKVSIQLECMRLSPNNNIAMAASA